MVDNQKFQEMQLLEQNLQTILFQKQAFDMELSETRAALKEIKDSQEDVFKIIGQLMIKKEKKEIIKELEEKEKLLSSRINIMEKQEVTLSEKLEETRQKLMNSK